MGEMIVNPKAVEAINSKITPQISTLATGVSKYVIGKLVIVDFVNAQIPAEGIATGEILYGLFAYRNPKGDGWIRNDGNTLIWKNGELASDIYITWIGVRV